jgi:hypothetical protein
MEQLDSHWTNFHETWYLNIYRRYVNKIYFQLKSDKKSGNFTCRQTHIFYHTSLRSLRMRNVWGIVSENVTKSHFILSNLFFFFRNLCRLWDSVGKHCRVGQFTDDKIMRCMRIACWITKATNSHSELCDIIAFPLQQRLHGRASILGYTYIAYVSFVKIRIWGV